MKFRGNRLNIQSLSRELEITLSRLTLEDNTRKTDWLKTKIDWRPGLTPNSAGMTIANVVLDYAEYVEIGGDWVHISAGFVFDVTGNGNRVEISPLPVPPIPKGAVPRAMSGSFYNGGTIGAVAYLNSTANGGMISFKKVDGSNFGVATGFQLSVSGIYRMII